MGIFPKKWCGQVAYHVSTARVPHVCQWYRAHQLVLCRLKALKALNINWEQAQEESASILNVLKALTLADISMERINVFDYSCCPLVNQ